MNSAIMSLLRHLDYQGSNEELSDVVNLKVSEFAQYLCDCVCVTFICH